MQELLTHVCYKLMTKEVPPDVLFSNQFLEVIRRLVS